MKQGGIRRREREGERGEGAEEPAKPRGAAPFFEVLKLTKPKPLRMPPAAQFVQALAEESNVSVEKAKKVLAASGRG